MTKSFIDLNQIFYKIKNEVSILFFFAWIMIAFFFSWGNTSLGMLLLLIHFVLTIIKGNNFNLVNYRRDNLDYLILFFLIWGLFTSFFAINKQTALSSSFGFVLVILLMFYGGQKLSEHKDFLLKVIYPVLVTGLFFSSIFTIYKYFIYNLPRAETFFVECNSTGTLMTIGFLLLLGFYEYKKQHFLLIPLILSLAALLLTFSRGALLGLVVALLFYFIHSKKDLMIFLLIISVLFVIIFLYQPFEERFLSIFSLEKNQVRINIWQSTINMFKDNYITGVGPGNFPFVYPEYALTKIKYFAFSHNIFLNMAVETGLLGLLLFGGIIFSILKKGFYLNKISPLCKGLFAAFVGTLVHEQFDCVTLYLDIGNVFWLLAGLIVAFYNKEIQKENF